MRFISKLEIKNGYLVKGRQLEGNRKIGNPLDYAIKYYNSGVDEIFFFDIVASLYNSQIINQIVKHVCSKIFILKLNQMRANFYTPNIVKNV